MLSPNTAAGSGSMKLRHLIIFCALASPAFAHPPPGYLDHSPQERAWWQCMRNNEGVGHDYICCDVSDGHVLKDSEWGWNQAKDGTRHYWIKVPNSNKPWPVPDDALVDSRRCGGPEPDHPTDAHAWYAVDWGMNNEVVGLEFYCFSPGTMY